MIGLTEVDVRTAGEHRVVHFQESKWTARGNAEDHHRGGLQR